MLYWNSKSQAGAPNWHVTLQYCPNHEVSMACNTHVGGNFKVGI